MILYHYLHYYIQYMEFQFLDSFLPFHFQHIFLMALLLVMDIYFVYQVNQLVLKKILKF